MALLGKFREVKLPNPAGRETFPSARAGRMAPGVTVIGGCEMSNVVALRPKDRLRQDGEAIAAIYRNLGTATAEQMVTRALGELALTMAGIAAQLRGHELADLSRQLRRLQRMAENLGMVSLGEVAGHARECLERADPTAMAAVCARLMRVAERSLASENGLADQSV